MRLIDRDIEILDTLATKVRLLSVPQIADAWWPDRASGKSQAVRRLRQLKAAGLIDEQTVHAYPPIPLAEPVATWAPGGPEPDCEAISYRLQSRWSGSPRLTPVYTASEQTARRFGGVGGRLAHPTQATHDLHVADLYLRARRLDPVTAGLWLTEDLRPKAGFRQKDPDVIIDYPDGRPLLVIEFGGRYDAIRVREFHEHCARQNWRWELW